MESKPSAEEAAEQLRDYETLRERSLQRGPSRGFALLGLWQAIILCAYAAMVLLTLTHYDSPFHFVLPMLLLGSIFEGAVQRFSVRRRRSPWWYAIWVALAAAIVLLGILRVGETRYPAWVDVLVLAAIFAALLFEPVRQLRRTRGGELGWAPQPLSTPVRCMTVLAGLVLGFLIAAVQWQYAPTAIPVLGAVLAGATVLLSRSRWGLERAGFEWAPRHWLAFSAGLAILYAAILLDSFTDALTTSACIVSGAIAALLIASAAFTPRRSAAEAPGAPPQDSSGSEPGGADPTGSGLVNSDATGADPVDPDATAGPRPSADEHRG
ncbi:hypothetical protein [Gulosibacter sp. 10]|uniref:hypothetical protein n=1 Tax=Gulosibacter sp. 10 TaxID=1255570 RepID=UPI00097F0AB6|nr:hypothetical protein [Gulosibacter sp. 10]SJM55811.1 hypothetical protein FM112_04300 [Gulosibacter sp. 10]